MKLRGGDRTIGVSDLDEAKDFFVEALGMAVLSQGGGKLVLDGGSKLTVQEGPSGGRVELETKGVAELVERLDEQGYYADGPKETPQGAYADVEGVEGVEVVIWEEK
jgi:catechol 2,3-dioxygenase-like lactoylglutathione lyase family enzyme